MKQAKKFIAECGGSPFIGGGSCGADLRSSSITSMDDWELENELHRGQRWEGNMVCGHWVGTSKASAEVKKEYKRRLAARQKQREERYKNEMARIKAIRAEATKKLNSGQKTTKQSFQQDIWREYRFNFAVAIGNMSSQAAFIAERVKEYKKIVEKWSKIKGINKDKIKIGKLIIAALNEKAKNLKAIVALIKEGKGKWWDISIPIEDGKTFVM